MPRTAACISRVIQQVLSLDSYHPPLCYPLSLSLSPFSLPTLLSLFLSLSLVVLLSCILARSMQHDVSPPSRHPGMFRVSHRISTRQHPPWDREHLPLLLSQLSAPELHGHTYEYDYRAGVYTDGGPIVNFRFRSYMAARARMPRVKRYGDDPDGHDMSFVGENLTVRTVIGFRAVGIAPSSSTIDARRWNFNRRLSRSYFNCCRKERISRGNLLITKMSRDSSSKN